VILFSGIGLFLFLMVIELSDYRSVLNPDPNYREYWTVKPTLETVSSLGVLLVAYGFQQNLFPIFNSLQVQTTQNALQATSIGLTYSSVIYQTMGVLALFTFGSSLMPSVLTNID
jgi:amino acid permease